LKKYGSYPGAPYRGWVITWLPPKGGGSYCKQHPKFGLPADSGDSEERMLANGITGVVVAPDSPHDGSGLWEAVRPRRRKRREREIPAAKNRSGAQARAAGANRQPPRLAPANQVRAGSNGPAPVPIHGSPTGAGAGSADRHLPHESRAGPGAADSTPQGLGPQPRAAKAVANGTGRGAAILAADWPPLPQQRQRPPELVDDRYVGFCSQGISYDIESCSVRS
jgi:hypothetical protein